MPIDDDNKEELDRLTYRFDDQPRIRKNIGDKLVKAVSSSFPAEWGGVKLVVKNVRYEPKEYTLTDQKNALSNEEFLSNPLKGDLELYDSKTGELLDSVKNKSLMRVPYYTERGTFIHKNNEYSSLRQLRLRPGIYSRVKANGELESQFNVQRGTGVGYRISMTPSTGIYKINIGQSSVNLYSVLHDIGVSDEELKDAWGSDVLAVNKAKYDTGALDKVYTRMVPAKDRGAIPNASREDKVRLLREAFDKQKVDQDVRKSTLGF